MMDPIPEAEDRWDSFFKTGAEDLAKRRSSASFKGPMQVANIPPTEDWQSPSSLSEYGIPTDAEPTSEISEVSASSRIAPTPFVLRDPSTIPPREWLYGNHYIRKFATATIAPGGMGKSSLALAEAVAMSTGKNLLGQHVRAPLSVWYWGGEDPIEETERRAAAICKHHNIEAREIEGRLFFDSGRKLSIRLATMIKQQANIDGALVDDLTAALKAIHADVMIIDPFVSSHGLGENDNTGIDWVIKAGWLAIADRARVAIDLVHHVRKSQGGQAEYTVDDARGASSIIGAVRSARVLNSMTAEEANTASVPTDDRWRYFRVEPGKTNMVARGGKPQWYRLHSVGLGNARSDRPEDLVGIVTPWTMPGVFDDVRIDDLGKVQAKIAEGTWGENVQAGDWAGYAVAAVLDINPADDAGQAKVRALLAAWIKSGALRVDRRHDPKRGKERPFIVVGRAA